MLIRVAAKVASLLGSRKHNQRNSRKYLTRQIIAGYSFLLKSFFLTALFISLLSSCAESDVSRYTAANIDLGVKNAESMVEGTANSDIAETYGNSSQGMKGAFIGGTAGALVGTASGAIGTVPGAAVGALLGAGYGKYIDMHTSLEDKLENRGANVVILGDQVLIVIPAARLFAPYTSSIKPQAYSTLALVAEFMNRFSKMLVKISAYSNYSPSVQADIALTQQQAENVAKILSASGVDARILYSQGCGGTRLVSSTKLDWEASDNYRIEISFEKLYV